MINDCRICGSQAFLICGAFSVRGGKETYDVQCDGNPELAEKYEKCNNSTGSTYEKEQDAIETWNAQNPVSVAEAV